MKTEKQWRKNRLPLENDFPDGLVKVGLRIAVLYEDDLDYAVNYRLWSALHDLYYGHQWM